jgi:hypothetical protein
MLIVKDGAVADDLHVGMMIYTWVEKRLHEGGRGTLVE